MTVHSDRTAATFTGGMEAIDHEGETLLMKKTQLAPGTVNLRLGAVRRLA